MPISRKILGGLAVGTAGLVACGASAQDADAPPGGLRLLFGLEQSIEAGDNLGLETPSEGWSTIATTRLTFALEKRTPIELLEFGSSTALVIENSPDTDGTEIEFGRPDLRFGYTREIPDALFAVTAYYREEDVDDDDDPADLTEESDTGTVVRYGVGVRTEVGRTAPIGFALDAGWDVEDYHDTTDPDLADSETWRIAGETRLRFSEVLTGTVGLAYSRMEEEDPGTTVTETTTATVGMVYAVSPRLDATGRIGYTEIETESFGVTTTTTGPVAALSLDYDMPNGSATADFSVTTDDEEGTRAELVFGRALDLPDGALAARLGVAAIEDAGLELIGGVAWTRLRPDQRLEVSLDRSVGFDEDADETTVVTTIDATWEKTVNELTTVGLDFDYAVSSAPSERIQEAGITARYARRLTRDWTFTGGIRYRVRDDAGGFADSPSVFASLGRTFEVRY